MVTAPAALATQQTRAVHRGQLSLLMAENPLFIHQNTWGFFFPINYFEYNIFLKWSTSPLFLLQQRIVNKIKPLSSSLDHERQRSLWWCTVSTPVWSQSQEELHHLGTWNDKHSESSPDLLNQMLWGWGQVTCVLTAIQVSLTQAKV